MEERDLHAHDDLIRSEAGTGQDFSTVAESFLSRREVLKAGASAAVVLAAGGAAKAAVGALSEPKAGLTFEPIPSSSAGTIKVAKGYTVQPFLKWGDPILRDAPEFDPNNLTEKAQEGQFGYNCDYVGYQPLPQGSQKADHGLLTVNHEYTNGEVMFPGWKPSEPTELQTAVEMAAHGLSVVEIKRERGEWKVVKNSRYNRRITAKTPFRITGPAAGIDAMKTNADPTGRTVLGTIGNCSGGKTPWGTILSGEENFQDYFGNAEVETDPAQKAINERYGITPKKSGFGWERFEGRFDCAKEPKESNRFGWIVEVDPYDPSWTPRKRTALGRFRHEAATTVVTKAGKLVMYSGDDAQFEYVYKFVAAKPYNAENRAANRDLLDDGTLYVAKFNANGTGEWLPLTYGEGPLTEANGFRSQGDVLVNTRRAADLLGATKMDRPEDIETNPVNHKVYIVLTNNTRRGAAQTDAMNPRAENKHGHIIELEEALDDHAATRFKWDIFLLCGDPNDPSTFFAGFPRERVSTVSCPDNIAFDHKGNLWIATDGMERSIKLNDGVFAVPTAGAERGKVTQFFASVTGSEVCGPEFTPDDTTLFLAIQHPGENSSFENPSTRWPDGGSMPPRPSVVAVTEDEGGKIGG